MKLPKGKTAESCEHFKRCSSMFGCKPHYTTCDFAPSRYVEKTPTSDNSDYASASQIEAFETFMIEYFDNCCDLERTVINGKVGTYKSQQTHDMFNAWNASTSHSRKRCTQ